MQHPEMHFEKLKAAWGFEKDAAVIPFGNGLINHTWKVCTRTGEFILQKINQTVFPHPQAIAQNISKISDYLEQYTPDYFFLAPLRTRSGDALFCDDAGCFRMFPFVKGSRSISVVTSERQAYEAARAFGRFTRLLDGFDASKLAVTIPRFHDLSFRFHQFEAAVQSGNKTRLQKGSQLFQNLMRHRTLVSNYEALKNNSDFKIRVTHHDTKISNVLFDDDDDALCVIDLDTVMPGSFISDVGDMLRTYLSPVGEEETDFSTIRVRDAYFKAIVRGYLREMKDVLTDAEKKAFVFAGKALVYMQALRFFTDYLNEDVYYGAAYEDQNRMRAENQMALLETLCAQEGRLQQIVTDVLHELGD